MHFAVRKLIVMSFTSRDDAMANRSGTCLISRIFWQNMTVIKLHWDFS